MFSYIGSWFNDDFKGQRIMTLEELLEIVPKDKMLNIEIKVKYDEENKIEEKVIEILKMRDRIDKNIIISSFSHRVIKNINKLESRLKVGLLITASILDIENYIKMNNLNIYSIHCYREFVSTSFIRNLNEIGIKSYIWTVDNKEDGEILRNFGVTGIITNYPDRFKKII